MAVSDSKRPDRPHDHATSQEDVETLWRALYVELLRKTLDNLKATPAAELSAATISAVRSLLDANKVNRDEFNRNRAVAKAVGELPFEVDEVPFN